MRLTKLDSHAVYLKLHSEFTREINDLKSLLIKSDSAREQNKTLVNNDMLQMKGLIESISLNVDLAKNDSDEQTQTGLNDLKAKLRGLDLTNDITTLKSAVSSIYSQFVQLQNKALTSTNGDCDDEKFDFLLEELKRVENLIVKAQPRAVAITNGGGNVLEVKQDGVTIAKNVKCLNFVGDVQVETDPNNPHCLTVTFPKPTNSFNSDFSEGFS